MQLNDLERIVPGLAEARQNERRRRAAAFAGLPWTVCGCECAQLTPQVRLELELCGNPFICSGPTTREALFQMLWRLNPAFGRRWSFAAREARRRVLRVASTISLGKAEREIGEYFAGMLQDMREVGGDTPRDNDSAGEYVHWFAAESLFYGRRCGLSMAEYRVTPYLVLQQLHRAHRHATEANVQFINASDQVVNAWAKQQTERLRHG